MFYIRNTAPALFNCSNYPRFCINQYKKPFLSMSAEMALLQLLPVNFGPFQKVFKPFIIGLLRGHNAEIMP